MGIYVALVVAGLIGWCVYTLLPSEQPAPNVQPAPVPPAPAPPAQPSAPVAAPAATPQPNLNILQAPPVQPAPVAIADPNPPALKELVGVLQEVRNNRKGELGGDRKGLIEILTNGCGPHTDNAWQAAIGLLVQHGVLAENREGFPYQIMLRGMKRVQEETERLIQILIALQPQPNTLKLEGVHAHLGIDHRSTLGRQVFWELQAQGIIDPQGDLTKGARVLDLPKANIPAPPAPQAPPAAPVLQAPAPAPVPQPPAPVVAPNPAPAVVPPPPEHTFPASLVDIAKGMGFTNPTQATAVQKNILLAKLKAGAPETMDMLGGDINIATNHLGAIAHAIIIQKVDPSVLDPHQLAWGSIILGNFAQLSPVDARLPKMAETLLAFSKAVWQKKGELEQAGVVFVDPLIDGDHVGGFSITLGAHITDCSALAKQP